MDEIEDQEAKQLEIVSALTNRFYAYATPAYGFRNQGDVVSHIFQELRAEGVDMKVMKIMLEKSLHNHTYSNYLVPANVARHILDIMWMDEMGGD